MKTVLRVLILGMAVVLPSVAGAAADLYLGDTAIFGGGPSNVQPNVMIILDTSGSMNDEAAPGNPYDPNITYTVSNSCAGGACSANTVYRCTAFGLECGNWTPHVANVSSVTTACGGSNPRNSLQTTGQWNSGWRRLQTSGACATGNGIYALGNWINWRSEVGAPEPKIDIAKRVVTNIVQSTTGVKLGLMVFNNNQGGIIRRYNSYTASVKDMDAIFSGTTTNRQALVNAISPIVANSWTPLAESLYESMLYFKGAQSYFDTPTYMYTSPIEAACQQNYVVIVTDGMSTQDRDTALQSICTTGANGIPGDCNQDGHEPANDPAKTYPNSGSDYLDDVAKYMHDTDFSTTFAGTQNVVTYTVGFGLGGANAGAVKLLQETANLGGGEAFLSDDEAELTSALTQILGQIIEVNSSFVAPVVPVSPENRTYSGARVYLGFFKPQSNTGFWLGNLKKYGIDDQGSVVDKNGDYANWVDNNGNGFDDRTNEVLPAGSSNGSFRSTSTSYWTATPDQGDVDSGGGGQALLDRDFSTNPRLLYTYLGNADLNHSSNRFNTTNITAAMLGVATNTDRDRLVNYVYGTDAYDQDVDGNTSEKREWILGDILHSKPVVVGYQNYTYGDEGNCSNNRTLILVGGNDGMFHAFKDCDGSEAWAFIPPDVLPNLTYLRGTTHTYFVDGSPTVYRYDADRDGNIETASGDKVIAIIGQRRGGGYYYALDISTPDTPQLLWRISASLSPSGVNTEYSELGQTWSDMELAKVKIGTDIKIVGIFGAGYDNFNEDGRYGAVTSFSTLAPSDTGEGNVSSAEASTTGVSPKGRGIYVAEIANISSGAPDLSRSGWKIWDYTYANLSTMRYSIPSSVATADTNYDGYNDRIYVGDTGGRMWAADIGSTSTSSWSVRRMFSGGASGVLGAGDRGRKIFFPPSVVLQDGYNVLAFGTGDREHPLNTAVVDRLYSVKDRGQTDPVRETDTDELVDVTTDQLQASADETAIAAMLQELEDQYGWFIRLENAGEKMLAPVLTFFYNYYTTYTPDAVNNGDPCEQEAIGTGRLYVVNYKTGEAVFNFDTSNDSDTGLGSRATNAGGEVVKKTDRVQTMGQGIPSGVVPIINADGSSDLLCAAGDKICSPQSSEKDTSIDIYWRRVL
ncbi:MAG: pilus assembly protein [Nitrospirota bacterium]